MERRRHPGRADLVERLLALTPAEFESLRAAAERELGPGCGLLAVALRQAQLVAQAQPGDPRRVRPPPGAGGSP